jgi:hypothetical protein
MLSPTGWLAVRRCEVVVNELGVGVRCVHLAQSKSHHLEVPVSSTNTVPSGVPSMSVPYLGQRILITASIFDGSGLSSRRV